MTAYAPSVRYKWLPTEWWGNLKAMSFRTRKEAEDYQRAFLERRGDEVEESRIIEDRNAEFTHGLIDGVPVPRNQLWRHRNHPDFTGLKKPTIPLD
jgi:hypothetical protein